MPPAEYEARYYEALASAAVPASPGGARRQPDPNVDVDATAAERLLDLLRPLENTGEHTELST